MSCPVKNRTFSDKPHETKDMIKKNQIYVWKEVQGNPNLYCWIPMSKKIANEILDVNDQEINIQDIPAADNFQDILSNIVEDIEDEKHKYGLSELQTTKDDDMLVSFDDPAKYNIVKAFIQDKGLKLYGGAAINAYLPREQKIYNPKDIPDFDFFSADPWNDAIELANLLYKKGYKYTEAKAGIHKGTYKVFANMWPVADITYMNQKDFDKLRTKTVSGLKIVEPFKLLESMYKEFSEPYTNPSRWPKVAEREKLLSGWLKPLSKKITCPLTLFSGGKTKIQEPVISMLNMIYKFCVQKKVVFAGNLAYNTYIEIGGGEKRLLVDSYDVLSENAHSDVQEIFTELLKIEKNLEITTIYRSYTELNSTLYNIYYVFEGDYKKLVSIAQLDNCVAYQTINKINIASIDFMKFLLLEAIVFEDNKMRKDNKCKLKYLTHIQNRYYTDKKINELDNSPFQRFVKKCAGPYKNTMKVEILHRQLKKLEEKTRIIKEYTDGYIIKKIPREKPDKNCMEKSKELCKYPCMWNHFIGKCQGMAMGVYRPDDRESLDE